MQFANDEISCTGTSKFITVIQNPATILNQFHPHIVSDTHFNMVISSALKHRSRALLWKLTVVYLVNKIPCTQMCFFPFRFCY
jgi:hypothetical protein